MSGEDVYQFIFNDIKKKLDNPDVIYTLHDKVKDFDPIPSGITVIDEVLSGGLPEGRIIEVFGPEASGKTTLTLTVIANAQKLGYIVYFIDAEHALDMSYAERIGVDSSKLLFSQPEYGEQALETVQAICESTEAAKIKFNRTIRSLVIIDSVPALVPKGEFDKYEKEGLDSTVALGGPARMLAGKLPALVGAAGRSGVTVVFINQERDKIGVTFGSPTTTPGGRALKFFSSLRLKVQRIGQYKQGEEIVGIRTQMIPVKSKLFPIFGRRAEFIIGPNGINQEISMVDTLIERSILKKSGSWFRYKDQSFQGKTNVETALREDKEFRKTMEEELAGTGGQSKAMELKVQKPKQAPSEPPTPDPSPEPLKPAVVSTGVRTIGANTKTDLGSGIIAKSGIGRVE